MRSAKEPLGLIQLTTLLAEVFEERLSDRVNVLDQFVRKLCKIPLVAEYREYRLLVFIPPSRDGTLRHLLVPTEMRKNHLFEGGLEL